MTTTTTTTLTPHQILAAARHIVCQRAPFFRAGVMNLVPRERPGLKTFATTKDWIMLWDPAVAIEWGVEGVAFVVLHEAQHLALDHFGRFSMPRINQNVANLAGDLSINPGILAMGFSPPLKPNGTVSGAWPERFDLPSNLTAEQYYEELLKKGVRCKYVDTGGSAGDGAEEKEKRKSNKGHDQEDEDEDEIVLDGCGSCSGRERADEPEDGDAEGRSEAEQRRTRIEIANEVKKHSRRGFVPAELAQWAESTLSPPKVRWQDQLARVARGAIAARAGSSYGTYTRPSRRQGGLGFGRGCPVMPSYQASTPRITLLIDTSGSMGEGALGTIMGETQGILAACNALIDVVVCDAAVHGARRVRSVAEACAMLKGGGGSNFCPAFDEIERRRPKADIVVAATDGDITVPDAEPLGVRVIWLLVKGAYNDGEFRRPCSWGTFIEVE